MTPNAVFTSAPSRRSLLASTAVATAAVTGGMPLLTACGGSDSGSREGATSGKDADKLLPTYVASTVAKPDLPSESGSPAGYTGKVSQRQWQLMSITAGSRPDGTRPPAAVEEPADYDQYVSGNGITAIFHSPWVSVEQFSRMLDDPLLWSAAKGMLTGAIKG